MHPYETIFVKEGWSAGEPHLSAYTRWAIEHFMGRPGTQGKINRELYNFALTATDRISNLQNIFRPHIAAAA